MQPTGYQSNVSQPGLEEPHGRMDAVKQKLGQVGRRLKRIEVRESIVEHPFAAIGIGAAVGALVGLLRPMPERTRTQALFSAALTAIAMKVVRDAAMRQLGSMARSWISGQPPEQAEPQYSPAR